MAGPVRSLSAILPAFEEAATLPGVVARLRRVLARCGLREHEILVVVSDAARDGTPAIAGSLPGVRVVPEAPGGGYGAAVAAGVMAARHDWLLLLDADGQLDPEELPRFLARAATAEAVVGERRPRADGWARRAAGWLYTRTARLLTPLPPLADLDGAFKLLERRHLGSAPLTCRTGAVNAELLLRLTRAGGRVASLPVRHHPRPAGRARFEWAGFPRPTEALRLARELLRLARSPHLVR